MTREQAIDLARRRALNSKDGHGYLPVTDADAAAWMPHEWVIDAIVAASQPPREPVQPLSDTVSVCIESDDDSEISEYDEATDCCYTPEGWYEKIDNWGDYSSVAVVEGEVTHWMPLPAPPQLNLGADGQMKKD